jgi:hypothetical protein
VTTSNPAANQLLTVKLPGIRSVVETPGSPASPDALTGSLTRQMAAGEEEAFRRFHQLYFDRLYHFLLAVARGEEHEARDALQDTFVRAWRVRSAALIPKRYSGAGSRQWPAAPPATADANSGVILISWKNSRSNRRLNLRTAI